MRKLFFLFALATASISLAACQADKYSILGSGDALSDGDTLYLSTDMAKGTPIDTAVVKNGKFEITAPIDSACFCMIYNPKKQSVGTSFILEPGTIKIILSEKPLQTKVTGTANNERWQEVQDSTLRIGLKMGALASQLNAHQLSETEESKKMAEMRQLNDEFKACLLSFAERNIDNEVGFVLLTMYPEELIPAHKKLALIEKMPGNIRQRTAIRELKSGLEKIDMYAEGKKMPDFTMADIDGHDVNILGEIKKHELTVIDFWASWCGPCRAEMPSVVKLYDEYNGKGLAIIGISLDEKRESWQQAVKTLGIKWLQLSDLKGWNNAAAQQFSVSSIPHTMVIDKEGNILARGLRGDALRDFVASRLK